MTALIVIGAILLLLAGLLALKATVKIEYKDDVKLTVRVLFFNIPILPKKEKTINPDDYSPKKFRKMMEKKRKKEIRAWEKKQKKKKLKAQKKQQKKLARQKEKEERRTGGSAKKHKKLSLTEALELIRTLLSTLTSRFSHHLRIELTRINITVATDDAAKTGILYGVVSQSVAYILEILDRVTNVKYAEDAQVSVDADFCSDKIRADVCIAVSLRVYHVFDILFRTLFRTVRVFISSGSKKSK